MPAQTALLTTTHLKDLASFRLSRPFACAWATCPKRLGQSFKALDLHLGQIEWVKEAEVRELMNCSSVCHSLLSSRICLHHAQMGSRPSSVRTRASASSSSMTFSRSSR